MLELAILGILHRAPMHGYELRKQLGCLLCGHRPAFSFGSLYPTLRRLQRAGLIAEDGGEPSASAGRARRVYGLSAAGREHFAGLLAEVTPQHWEDDCFGVRLAFFSRTPPEARLRILAAGGAAWRNGRNGSGPPWTAPASTSTTTPGSCSDSAWTAPSARCGGWTS